MGDLFVLVGLESSGRARDSHGPPCFYFRSAPCRLLSVDNPSLQAQRKDIRTSRTPKSSTTTGSRAITYKKGDKHPRHTPRRKCLRLSIFFSRSSLRRVPIPCLRISGRFAPLSSYTAIPLRRQAQTMPHSHLCQHCPLTRLRVFIHTHRT